MRNSLKLQLLISSLAAIVLLLVAVFCITKAHLLAAVILIALVCLYLVAVNLWFWGHITNPLAFLASLAGRIADGSYGTKSGIISGDEVGTLAAEIDRMSEKVGIAEKSRTDFISQVSHELRTPLTAIEGWAETIKFDEAVQGDSLKGVNIIAKEAERLTGMVSELLEFARIQDGRFNLRVELLDIAAELEDALFTYGELLKQAGITVNYNGPESELPLISGDPERLKQVFLNLLDNASKHGGDGNVIDVSVGTGGRHAVIVIRDHGKGIPEAELPHVKEKFYKGSSKNRGTGIGLSVCDEIIARHNGFLEIANAEGGGCAVTIRLPLQETK